MEDMKKFSGKSCMTSNTTELHSDLRIKCSKCFIIIP